MPQTPKEPKNMPCECGSKKKAKHCCMKGTSAVNTYSTGQTDSSEQIIECMNMFKENFPEHRVIDITSKLSDITYKPYQLANFNSPVIMLAEKTVSNSSVFESRVNSPLSNIMVLYHGSYRTFEFSTLQSVFSSVCEMINIK